MHLWFLSFTQISLILCYATLLNLHVSVGNPWNHQHHCIYTINADDIIVARHLKLSNLKNVHYLNIF